MNLLVRINSGLILVFGLFLFSCDLQNDGFEFELDNNISVQYEEFTLKSTNLAIDSLRTDIENRVLFGNYNHPELGSVNSLGYLHYRFSGGAILSDSLVFDSLVLDLNFQERLSPEGLISDNFLIYEVLGTIHDEAVYLANFDVEINPEPIDTLKAFVSENEILNHTRQFGFGQRLFDQLIETDTTTIGFTGSIALGASDETMSLVSIDLLASDSTKFSVFTSDSDGNSYETRFNFTGIYYSKLSRDRLVDGTPISNLDTFQVANNFTFVNSIFGVHTLVDLSPLKTFTESADNILINRAEISYPTFGQNSNADEVRYYLHKPETGIKGDGTFTDPINSIILTNASYAPPFNGSVLVSELDSISYFADVTLFTEFYLNKFITDDEFLADRFVITNNQFLDLSETKLVSDEIKFRVYYTTIN